MLNKYLHTRIWPFQLFNLDSDHIYNLNTFIIQIILIFLEPENL